MRDLEGFLGSCYLDRWSSVTVFRVAREPCLYR